MWRTVHLTTSLLLIGSIVPVWTQNNTDDICTVLNVTACRAYCLQSVCPATQTTLAPTAVTAGTTITFTQQGVTTADIPTGLLTNEPIFSLIILALVALIAFVVLLISFCIVRMRKRKEESQPWSRMSTRKTTVIENKGNGRPMA